MNMLQRMLKMISYQENLDCEGFILKETKDDRKKSGPEKQDKDKEGRAKGSEGEESAQENNIERQYNEEGEQEQKGQPGEPAQDKKSEDYAGRQDVQGDKAKEGRAGKQAAGKSEDGKQPPSRKGMKRPLRPSEIKKGEGGKEKSQEKTGDYPPMSTSLKENRETIQKLYGLPENKDIVVRNFVLGTQPPVKGFAVYIDGLTDKAIQDLLFQALMLFTDDRPSNVGKLIEYVKERLLPAHQISVHGTIREVLDAVNFGETAIFLEHCADALTVETKGWEHRNIDRPVIEQIIRGPQEAFGENLRANTALIRKKLKSENLVTEMTKIGIQNRNDVAIMYLRHIANPDLVTEVKRRLDSIKIDYLADSGVLEQLLEDNPYNLNPQMLATERPDRVTGGLAEGRVAILVDGTPYVLVVPTTMYELLHTGEETYLRWQYGTFIRYIRTLAFYIAFLLPGSYLAVVLFHHEMIPTELLLAIAGNRERVPFPSVVEVLMMEFAFELIREASLRLPGVMGSTIGIVGALILGQAAVQANIVSPILVILVGVTGLANFTIPSYSMSFALRIYRFLYIFLGAALGFFGITLGLVGQVALTANLKSFGVPYLAPTGPRTMAGSDVVTRLPVFFSEKRPDYVNPLDITREPQVSRGWIKGKGGGGNDRSG